METDEIEGTDFQFNIKAGEFITNVCYDFGVSLNMIEYRTNKDLYKAGFEKNTPSCIKVDDSQYGN